MKTTKCKSCGTEMSATKGAVCPSCGRVFKKPFYQRVWFIALVVVVVFGAIGSAGGSNKDKENIPASTNSNATAAQPEEKKAEAAPAIEYTAVTAKEMLDTLDNNALKAESTYQDAYIELTGKLNSIDSDGKYITLVPLDEEFAITSIQCSLTNEEQKSKVVEMSTGDTVVLKGQVTDVGEILGYSLDIDTIE